MKEAESNIQMVTPENSKATRMYHYFIECFGRLGMPIHISPKANISFNKPGYKSEYFVETVTLVVGIGKDHTADLVMSREAWEALNSGEEVNYMTTKEFAKKYGRTADKWNK